MKRKWFRKHFHTVKIISQVENMLFIVCVLFILMFFLLRVFLYIKIHGHYSHCLSFRRNILSQRILSWCNVQLYRTEVLSKILFFWVYIFKNAKNFQQSQKYKSLKLWKIFGMCGISHIMLVVNSPLPGPHVGQGAVTPVPPLF